MSVLAPPAGTIGKTHSSLSTQTSRTTGAGVASSNTSGNERYYDFIKGPVHVFALDSEGALNSAADMAAQRAWLQAQLAASTARWQIVLFHHPAYSSDSDDYGNTWRGPTTAEWLAARLAA